MTDHPYPPGTLVTRVAGPLAGSPFIVVHSKPAQYTGDEHDRILYYVEGCDSNRLAAYTSRALRPWGGDIDMLSADAQHRVRMLRQSAVLIMPVSRRDFEAIVRLTEGETPDPFGRRLLMRLFDELESLPYCTDRDIETEEEMHAGTD